MVDIIVSVDRKAALLLGHDLPARTAVTVTPSDLGPDLWPVLVGMLDTDQDPAVLSYQIKIAEPTAEAVRATVQAHLDSIQEQKSAGHTRALAKLVDIRAKLETLRQEAAQPMTRVEKALGYTGFVYQGYQRPLTLEHNWFPYFDKTPLTQAERAELDAIEAEAKTLLDASRAEVKAADEAELERLKPEIEAFNAKVEQARVERGAEIAAIQQARCAERLATGYWEKDTGSYNSRRYKAPWCAKVSAGQGRDKLDYEFGDSTARNGSSGLLRVACVPGEIVVWGQTDLRGNGGGTTFLRMLEDGSMEEITRTEAYKAVAATTKKAS